MEIYTTFEFEVSSSTLAEKVVNSLKSDIENTSEFFERSSLMITSSDKKILLEIKASDITSAKASINSCLHWIENSIQILEKYNIDTQP